MHYLSIIFLLLITSSCSCLRWNGQQPEGLISPEKADTLEMNYVKNQYRFINGSIANDSIIYGEETIFSRESKPFPINKKNKQHSIQLDNLDVWFSFNEIVGFLTMAQKHADSKGYKNLGIRIYLGSYIKDGKPKTTVFLVATYRNPDNNTIINTFITKSGSQTIDPNHPELQIDMEGAGYLNMGSSRRRPPE